MAVHSQNGVHLPVFRLHNAFLPDDMRMPYANEKADAKRSSAFVRFFSTVRNVLSRYLGNGVGQGICALARMASDLGV